MTGGEPSWGWGGAAGIKCTGDLPGVGSGSNDSGLISGILIVSAVTGVGGITADEIGDAAGAADRSG
jgi:hypothetical protein